MHVLKLEAENIKRLRVISIEPKSNVVEVTGKNRAGKTSCLDSIFWGLAGKGAIQSSPIRRGEESAFIKLDLGTLKVRRTFNAQGDGGYTTAVTVENADGARFNRPQDILDALVSELTFDPLAFTHEHPKDQVKTLQGFVAGIDFAALAGADTRDTETRRDKNREAKALRTQAQAITAPVTPPEAVDEDAILTALGQVSSVNVEIERERRRRASQLHAIQATQGEAIAAYERADALREEIKQLELRAETLTAGADKAKADFAALPPLREAADTEDLTAQLQAGRQANAIVQQIAQRTALETRAAALEAESDALTEAMATRLKQRQAAVEAAKLPVDGLGFDGDIVTLNGLPFDQASDAEQLRASIGIAAALNPKLRIARVRDGSRLDTEAMAALAEFAAEFDIQVWLETVESGRESAIVIEDGAVKGAPAIMAAE
jgi:DNA repair exonuclease SbcCD ATPase subunit